MKQNLSKRAVVCLLALFMIMILMCNTNNHPDHFLIRIFPPYEEGNSKFFYANLIVIIIIPFILFDLHKGTQWTFLDSVPKRLFWTIIFIAACTKVSEVSVQVYKSFQGDLDAIYLDREQMGIEYHCHMLEENGKNYNVYDGQAYITLKNCSRKTKQNFKIKLVLKGFYEEERDTILENAVNTEQIFSLEPGETWRIPIKFSNVKEKLGEDEVGMNGSGKRRIQEAILYNDEQSVYFVEGTL